MQQSTKHGRLDGVINRPAVTTDEAGQSSQGSSPSGSPSGKSPLGTGLRSQVAAAGTTLAEGHQLEGSHLEAIDRNAEEALQIQVGAMRSQICLQCMSATVCCRVCNLQQHNCIGTTVRLVLSLYLALYQIGHI